MSPYLRPAEWSSTHHELSGQGPSDSETPTSSELGPLSSATVDNQPCEEENWLAEDSPIPSGPFPSTLFSLPFCQGPWTDRSANLSLSVKALSQGGVRGQCGVGTRAASTLNAVRSRGTELRGLRG